MTPLQFLEIEVIGPDGAIVSEGHFSDRFSPSAEPAVLRLMPGERFTAQVSLLAPLRREQRRPGRYTVRASYRFDGRKILADRDQLINQPLGARLLGAISSACRFEKLPKG